MEEDIRKNFILLSKIAKEKKYAQEYLGLLARRGDIGSIRIGKRWYTTWAWFEEFLENSQKKKEVVSEVQIAEPIKVEPAKVFLPTIEKEEIKINVPLVFPARPPARQEREKVFIAHPAANIQREERTAGQPAKIAVAVKTRKVEIRKNFVGDIREIKEIGENRRIKMYPVKVQNQNFIQEAKFRNISVAQRNKHAIPYPEIKFRKKADVFSPDFSGKEKIGASLFPRFAFAFSFAIILLLVAVSGYFVWSGGLLKSGQVAGASDERNGGFPGIKSGSEYVLTNAGDKIKQSLSISKLVIQAVKEKSANNGQ